jgi:hypothetical protein
MLRSGFHLDRLAVDAAIARRISRWRGSRMHWKPSASTVTLLASFARVLRRARLAEDIALDLADAELADQLQVVVGLDALGGRCPCRGSRRA